MDSDIESSLRLCPTLPTLSGVALSLVKIGHDPDVDLNDVARLIANDPALAAKTLRVANSPLYGRGRRQARNLRQAVTTLGMNATVTLALSFSLADCLKHFDDQGIDLDQYWRRALLSALAARLLAEQQQMRSLDEIFLASLLQDMGMLALNATLPERYAAKTVKHSDHESLCAREREALGTDHREAGAWLMREWGLPEYLALSALRSHDLGSRAVPADLASFVGCVAVSGRIAGIYLADDTEAATATAMEAAQACLAMSSERLGEMLARMADALPEIESLFETPVLSKLQAVGLTDQAQELIAARNVKMLEDASRQRSRADEFKQAAEELEELSRRDVLTGIFNRRYFDEMLEKEFAHARTYSWPISLAYLDLDHFKSINDHHGHAAGDAVLTALAGYMQSQLRQGDLLARYGGEEFVLLMPGIGLPLAHKIVERLRATVARYEHTVDSGESFYVTLSVGVAAVAEDDTVELDTTAALLKAADRALYEAKRLGRNRIVAAG